MLSCPAPGGGALGAGMSGMDKGPDLMAGIGVVGVLVIAGKGVLRVAAAMVSCVLDAAVPSSHGAGGCVFRLAWIVALTVPLRHQWYLPVLRLAEYLRMAGRQASLMKVLLVAQCVPVE